VGDVVGVVLGDKVGATVGDWLGLSDSLHLIRQDVSRAHKKRKKKMLQCGCLLHGRINKIAMHMAIAVCKPPFQVKRRRRLTCAVKWLLHQSVAHTVCCHVDGETAVAKVKSNVTTN
jgi:hypothetical protein